MYTSLFPTVLFLGLSLTPLSYALPTPDPAPVPEPQLSSSLLSLYSRFNHLPSGHGLSPPEDHLLPRSISSPSTQRPRSLPAPQSPNPDLLMGNIKMKSSQNHQVPLAFSLSGMVCSALAEETGCLVNDLTSRLVSEHENGIPFPSQWCAAKSQKELVPVVVSETITHAMGNEEFRATLEIKLTSQAQSGDVLDGREWSALVGLLGGSVLEIEKAAAKNGGAGGLGTVLITGEVEGVKVEALWAFYRVLDGVSIRCE